MKIFVSGDWPKQFIDIMIITLPKENKTKKCMDNRTNSLISHTEKIIACTISKILRSKIIGIYRRGPSGFRNLKTVEMLLD